MLDYYEYLISHLSIHVLSLDVVLSIENVSSVINTYAMQFIW
jgi:hypothetical protein